MSVSQQMQMSESGPVTKSPFGNLPFSIAQGVRGAFSKPLGQAFGYGGGKKSPYEEGKGPLGGFINQAVPTLQNFIPDQTRTAGDLMGKMNSAYGGYQQALDTFMQQLPGFESSMAAANTAAQTNLQDAMSPLGSRATFQEASRRALAPAREGAAARGMLEGGQAQAGEQGLLSDLAFQALQSDAANRNAAIGQAGELAQGGAGLAALGPQAQQALLQMIPQLAQTTQGISQMPMGAVNQALSFLQQTQDPNMRLLQMVAPTVANSSKSFGGGGSVGLSDQRMKEDIVADVPGVEAVRRLTPVSYRYRPGLDVTPRRHLGLLAQNVQEVVPTAVVPHGDVLTVDYQEVTAVLVQAVRELTDRLDRLEARGE